MSSARRELSSSWGISRFATSTREIYDSQDFRLLVKGTQNYFSLSFRVFCEEDCCEVKTLRSNWTHISSSRSSRVFWDCEGFFLPCYYYYARSCYSCYCFASLSLTHSSSAVVGGRSHTQTLKSHDNIWCKVGDTYFLLYFCHMLLFKREKIVFYG